MRRRFVLAAIVGLALTPVSMAQRELSVGDNAPGLDIEAWVKGEETTLDAGEVFVVEFWATWCGPCKKSIPHLTELQQEYGDNGLTIIGISDEPVETVQPFVDGQGHKMDYTVAVDRRNSTKRAWLDAAGAKGIPTAFIVDRQSKIVFIGHPLDDEFESILRRVLSGRYDPRLEREAKPMLKAARNARKSRNWRMAMYHFDQAIELDVKVFADVAMERFEMQLVDMGERQAAYDYARSELMQRAFIDDAEALRMLAAKVATDPVIPADLRDLDFALECATVAQALAGNNDPDALATIALVRYQRREIDQAVRAQKRAYFLAKPKRKAEFRRVLDTYQKAEARMERVGS